MLICGRSFCIFDSLPPNVDLSASPKRNGSSIRGENLYTSPLIQVHGTGTAPSAPRRHKFYPAMPYCNSSCPGSALLAYMVLALIYRCCVCLRHRTQHGYSATRSVRLCLLVCQEPTSHYHMNILGLCQASDLQVHYMQLAPDHPAQLLRPTVQGM